MSTELEDRIARALDRRADAPMDVDLDAVRRGARHRRARRRAGTALALAVVAGGAVTGVAIRDTDAPSPEAPAAAPEPPSFGAGALLPPELVGPPTDVDIDRGGMYNVALPQTDVWESAAGRIVVHTRLAADESIDVAPATTVPATTAVPAPGDVVDVPGAPDGVVEQLADDQWVMYLTPEREQGDFVIARGMSRGDAERTFRSLVMVDGVLQPSPPYELVDRADAVPASPFPVGWAARIGFGTMPDLAGLPGSHVTVSEPVFGRDTIELAASWPAALIDVGGREVAEIRPNETQSSFVWRDPSGVFVTVWSFDGSITRDTIGGIVDGTRLVAPGEVLAIADSMSASRAAKPAVARGQVGNVTITLRGTATDVVLCLGAGLDEQCTALWDASLSDSPINATVDAIVDGEWIIAGVFELEGAGFRPDIGDDRYTLPDGSDVPITVVESDGRLWWVARVPAGVDRITTHAENDTGLRVGTVVRPVVIGPLG